MQWCLRKESPNDPSIAVCSIGRGIKCLSQTCNRVSRQVTGFSKDMEGHERKVSREKIIKS
jgi:hypothetical protein